MFTTGGDIAALDWSGADWCRSSTIQDENVGGIFTESNISTRFHWTITWSP